MNNMELVKRFVKVIKTSKVENFKIMEVCGTHTKAISRLGIRQLFSSKITLLSGPGCPVCVTPENYIDNAIELLKWDNVILTTFGDLMKVKGSKGNLVQEKEKGKKIKILYSPLDSIKVAEENKNSEVVFLAVGFEITAPLIALAIKIAKDKKIENLSFFTGLKTMKPVLRKILEDKTHKIDGMICPGHVAVVKGADYFKFISEEYNIPAVVAGFEAEDILAAIYFLTQQKDRIKKDFANLYKSCVTSQGNIFANKIMDEVFYSSSARWRGIGNIENSALNIKDMYNNFNAIKRFQINLGIYDESEQCLCSEILLGRKLPSECKLFKIQCNPTSPYGPGMISQEGSCSVFYQEFIK
ncbi:hydrogenase formation protein HypD [Clostridium sp. A1-XYC3]|uniref:Hydrogenase formation protein HypD n=1 Tax=Clostridium tanneri TaxID=3037988 RepID=A0ABU4JY59_9CLOT|nr:hydrogenase formation protein HypD [Clostridium sp. A1-XYC3]MDW8803111.1 hydrogenase formation protein HypD [Clostridium sp. A1-XYC3]